MTTPEQAQTGPQFLTVGPQAQRAMPQDAPEFDPPEFADEEVLFRRDGTIIWKVDGQRTVLRRPKFKELRTLNEEIAALAESSRLAREPLTEAMRALSDPITAKISVLDEEDPDTADVLVGLERDLRTMQTSAEYLDISAKLRAQRDDADSELLGWFRDSILCRFGRPVPRIEDPEDLPKWCIDPTFTRELLTHWASVPRRPGVV